MPRPRYAAGAIASFRCQRGASWRNLHARFVRRAFPIYLSAEELNLVWQFASAALVGAPGFRLACCVRFLCSSWMPRLHTMRHCASRCIGPFLHLMQMHSTALALQCTMQMMQVGSNASRCKMQNNASLVASQCGIVAYRGKYEQPALFFCYSIS